MKRARPWLPADDAALIGWVRAGLQQRQIARQMGRSEHSLVNRRHWLQKTGQLEKHHTQIPWRPADNETLRELIRQGKTNRHIAAELGRTIGSVDAQRRKLGLTRENLGAEKPPKPNSSLVSAFNEMRMVVTPWETLPDGTQRRLVYRAGDEAAAAAHAAERAMA